MSACKDESSQIRRLMVELLTPIHIGSGVSYREYYMEGLRVFRMDLEGVTKDQEFSKYERALVDSALKGDAGFSIYKIAPDLIKRHTLYSVEAFEQNIRGEIREHIKSNGKPYLPASSLKGALLTALLWKYIKEGEIRVDRYHFNLKGRESGGAFVGILNQLFEKICENPLPTERTNDREGRMGRFRRWIGISDPRPAEIRSLRVVGIKVYPRGPQMPAEVMWTGTTFEVDLFKYSGLKMTIDDVLKASDDFYRNVLSEENAWRRTMGLEELRFEGKTLVRVGWGSSQLATSVRLAVRTAYQLNKPRTRKLVTPGMLPMGWALLK